jgi:hypothetical protein
VACVTYACDDRGKVGEIVSEWGDDEVFTSRIDELGRLRRTGAAEDASTFATMVTTRSTKETEPTGAAECITLCRVIIGLPEILGEENGKAFRGKRLL